MTNKTNTVEEELVTILGTREEFLKVIRRATSNPEAIVKPIDLYDDLKNRLLALFNQYAEEIANEVIGEDEEETMDIGIGSGILREVCERNRLRAEQRKLIEEIKSQWEEGSK